MRTGEDAVARQRQEFGRWLAQAREAAGYTQEQAAERAGVSRVTWARWESGTNSAARGVIPALADAIRKPADEAYVMAGLIPPSQNPDKAREELAERLRSRRERIRLTQDEVADALNIPRSTYTQYETARVNLPSELVRPLCRILGVSSDWLFGMEETHHEPPRGSGIEPDVLDELKRFIGETIRATVAIGAAPAGNERETLPDSSIGRAADSGSRGLKVGHLLGGIALAGAF